MSAEANVRPATIEDVARAAGVSRAAVSKVLRNAYGVSPAMRDRVAAAMDELSYRPRVAARAMRGHSYTIGIEIPDFGNQFFSRMLQGAAEALADSPYQIVIAPAEAGVQQGLRAIQALADRQVDAIIAVSPRVPQESLEAVAGRTPVVMFGRHDISSRYDTVVGDDLGGARAAMSHLFGLGHTRVAHLTLDGASSTDRSPHGLRLAAYETTMRQHSNIELRVLATGEGQAAAYSTVRDALEKGADFTALFAGHDELALGASRAIEEAGVDVSLVGYDDVPIASHPALGLTTIAQPGHAMGIRAVQLLLERLAGRTHSVQEVFPVDLLVRTSTRRPRL